MKRLALPTLLALMSLPAPAWAGAEGPGTPQATAANATFLSNAPIPPTGRGVCVIDTGVDTDTDLGPALAGRTTTLGGGGSTDPADFGTISDTGDLMPKHGTYVAGIIASQVDGTGTSGIWPAARIYSARVFAGGSATALVNDYITAMDWCRDRPGVTVVNLSLSGLGGATIAQRASLDDKIAELRGAPYLMNVVAAAGNNGSSATVGYPATSAGVFGVGATETSGALASFSNRGSGLDIAAFGAGSCVTTSRGSKLGIGLGTSYAAPVVSAVLAALRSYDSSLSPGQAEQLLLQNADIVAGVRVLNAARAFRADSAVAALAGSAPWSGLDRPASSACEIEAPPAREEDAEGVSVSATPSAAPSTVMNPAMPVTAPLIDVVVPLPASRPAGRPSAPVLRSVTHRGGSLTVRVGGCEANDRTIYRVAFRVRGQSRARTFVRRTGILRVRVPNWTAVRVHLERPGFGRSGTLVVRPNDEF